MMLFNYYKKGGKYTVDGVYILDEEKDPIFFFEGSSDSFAAKISKAIEDYNKQLGLTNASAAEICGLPFNQGDFKLAKDAQAFKQELYKNYNFNQ